MNTSTTALEGMQIEITAHSGASGNLLMLSIEPAVSASRKAPVVNTVVVLDRSGSMEGAEIRIARSAIVKMIRSLSPQDRVGLVVFDDIVDIVGKPEKPSEELAEKVLLVSARNCTNLHGGWVTGVAQVGPGGRVILVSDGQANCGKWTKASDLGRESARAYEKNGVSTTTIGVGVDFDEAVMSAMASRSGGNHYFAESADALMDAFSQERFSLNALAFSRVSVCYTGGVRQVGHLWQGERRCIVLAVEDLQQPVRLSYCVPGSDAATNVNLVLPPEFGVSEEVTFQELVQRAADVEEKSIEVRTSESAAEVREVLRSLLLELLAHSQAESDLGAALINRLQASKDRLDQLVASYDEDAATLYRKHSTQLSASLNSPSSAYSSDADAQKDVRTIMACAQVRRDGGKQHKLVDLAHEGLPGKEKWLAWNCAPLFLDDDLLTVASTRPRDGFLQKEIEAEIGMQVHFLPETRTPKEIARLLAR